MRLAEIKKNSGASPSIGTPYKFGFKQVAGELFLKEVRHELMRAVPVVSGPFQGSLSTIPNASIPKIMIIKNVTGTNSAEDATSPGG